jgi:hypothetical protein
MKPRPAFDQKNVRKLSWCRSRLVGRPAVEGLRSDAQVPIELVRAIETSNFEELMS